MIKHNQEWSFVKSTGQIVNRRGICLATAESSVEKVQLQPCDTSAKDQQWRFIGVSDDVDHLSREPHNKLSRLQMPNERLGEPANRETDSCRVTGWSKFTECTKSCGSGIQKRTRAILQVPRGGASTCGHLVESRICAQQPCSALRSCVVGAWTKFDICTHKCGGGVQVRTRKVVVQADPGGTYCPTLVDERQCNTFGCVGEPEPAIVTLRSHAANAKHSLDSALETPGPDNVADVLKAVESYALTLAGGTKHTDEASTDHDQVTELTSEMDNLKLGDRSDLKNEMQRTLSFEGAALDLDSAQNYAEANVAKQQKG
jgi:hypothetical protein